MTKRHRELEKAARNVWGAIMHAAESSTDASRLVDDLEATTLRGEREHRAMGHRFTDGRAGYTLPVHLTARLFACRAVLDPHPKPTSWAEVYQVREDIRIGGALAEMLAETRVTLAHNLKAVPGSADVVLSFNYTADACAREAA